MIFFDLDICLLLYEDMQTQAEQMMSLHTMRTRKLILIQVDYSFILYIKNTQTPNQKFVGHSNVDHTSDSGIKVQNVTEAVNACLTFFPTEYGKYFY